MSKALEIAIKRAGEIHSNRNTIKQKMNNIALIGTVFKGYIQKDSLIKAREAWRKLNEQLKELQQEQRSLM